VAKPTAVIRPLVESLADAEKRIGAKIAQCQTDLEVAQQDQATIEKKSTEALEKALAAFEASNSIEDSAEIDRVESAWKRKTERAQKDVDTATKALAAARGHLQSELTGLKNGWRDASVDRFEQVIEGQVVAQCGAIELRASLAGDAHTDGAKVLAAIETRTRARFSAHIDWLVYLSTCKTLRAQLTQAERRSIIATAADAIKEATSMIGCTVRNQIPGPLSTQHGIFLHLCGDYCAEHGLNAVPKKVLPELQNQAANQYAAMAAPARKAIAAAETARDAALAELDTMPLADLIDRYRAAADKMLNEQAETARIEAEAQYPSIDALRAGMTLDGGIAKAEQAARKANGQAAFDRVLAMVQPIALPIEPSSPCPENIEAYVVPLAHLLPQVTAPAAPAAATQSPPTRLPMHEIYVPGLQATA